MEKYIYISELDVYISNYGNIKRFKKSTNSYNIVNLGKDAYGYNRIVIKNKTYKVHRLVAKYVMNKNIDGITINHKDFNKSNNHVDNLEIMSVSENIIHYIENKTKKTSSSSFRGVGFHVGIKKWTTRVTYNNKRISLGVFEKEIDAINAIKNFNKNKDVKLFKTEKGKGTLGKSKYSEQDNINALILAEKIGLIKAGKETKMGSSKISYLRKIYKKSINGSFVKNV